MEAQEAHIPSLLLRGELHYLYRKHEESLKDLNNVLRVDPYEEKAYYFKGLNFKELGDFEKAVSQFQTTVEQNPYHIDAYEQLAFIYAYLGNTIAELYFDNALAVDSSNIQMWYNKGMYLQRLERYADAEKCYKAMLRRDKFNQFANYNLGYLNWLKQESMKWRLIIFQMLFTPIPNMPKLILRRGLCFKELGNIPQARVDFQSAFRLDETNTEAKRS